MKIVKHFLDDVYLIKGLRRTIGPYGSEREQGGDIQALGDDYWGCISVVVYLGTVCLSRLLWV